MEGDGEARSVTEGDPDARTDAENEGDPLPLCVRVAQPEKDALALACVEPEGERDVLRVCVSHLLTVEQPVALKEPNCVPLEEALRDSAAEGE